MAVSTPPAPGWSPPAPGAGRPSSPASPLGQVATFAVVALALVLPLQSAGEAPMAVAACAALAAGIALGLGAQLAPRFANVPGFLAAVLALGATVVLTALAAAVGLPFPPWQLFPLVFLLVLGLDWTRVERLRLLVFLGGVLVVPMVGIDRGWALPAAIAWLVVAIGALWVLEHDRRNALAAPVPLGPAHGPGPASHPADLARTLGLALVVGLAAAFLLGNPSCSFDPPDVDPPQTGARPGDPSGGEPGEPGPGGRSFQEYDLETPTQERGYELGPGGERSFVDPDTGERDTVERRPDGTAVVRDEAGREVAELDDEGVVAKDGADEQRYRVDDEGQFTVESPDGETYRLGEEDGEPVLRDGQGEVVARSDGDGHLVVRDPEGDVLVDDPDGDGEIPVPDGAVRHGIGAEGDPVGRTYRTEGDRTTVTDPDGTIRVHDQDGEGNPRLRVEEPGREPRTYVYEPDAGGRGTWVNEYDDDGTLVDRYRYDPDAELVDGQVDEGTGTGEATEDPEDEGGGDDHRVWWLLGAVAVALAVATWWYLRRNQQDEDEAERTWAEQLQARLEELGRERGRRRGDAETVAEYAAALASGVLSIRDATGAVAATGPHEQLVAVGRVLSDALFGPTQPDEATKAWARSVVEAAAEANPLAGRRSREQPATTSS